MEEAVLAGRTLEEAQAAITLPEYADWGLYQQWLPLNIEGAYTFISARRIGNPAP